MLSKDLVALSLMTSASTSLIGESKAGLHLEKVGGVEGRGFSRLGIRCIKVSWRCTNISPESLDLHGCDWL